jgi:uncharacterized protein (TIGR02147 family)
MKSIFEYTNYREYLRDFYEQKKAGSPYYSYRLFAEKAGFKAPNLLKLVTDGQRNLTKGSVLKFARGLKLNKAEADYFENLVFFNQSSLLDEKNIYLRKLMKYRAKSDPRRIEASEYEYYSAWWHPVVRELSTAMDFRGDYGRLGEALIPPISGGEAQKSLQLLVRLGFVEAHADGSYSASSPSLTTGPRVRSVAVANYHREMMKLASESIERFAAAERDITSLTLGVSEPTMRIIVERLQALRKDLLELAEAERSPDRVVQLNLQLFPLSRTVERRGAVS